MESSLNMYRADFFPIPKMLEVVSHPVNDCRKSAVADFVPKHLLYHLYIIHYGWFPFIRAEVYLLCIVVTCVLQQQNHRSVSSPMGAIVLEEAIDTAAFTMSTSASSSACITWHPLSLIRSEMRRMMGCLLA